jgi:acyl-CoA synthetase (NDP forming)
MKRHIPSVEALFDSAARQNRFVLLEHEAYDLLNYAGIETPRACFIADEPSLERFIAGDLRSFPKELVLKISSPDIQHKSEAGGVLPASNRAEDVREAFAALRGIDPHAGVLAAERLDIRHELLLSLIKEEGVGYVLSFGLGGELTEIFEDISLRLPPLEQFEAEQMIRELKYFRVLKGYRGKPGADMESLAAAIRRFGNLAALFESEAGCEFSLKELEINPLAVTADDRVVAADALATFSRRTGPKIFPAGRRAGIEAFFSAGTAALVGASDEYGKVGKHIFDSMLNSGFKKVIPVNPKKDRIGPVAAFGSLADVRENIDRAVVVVPAGKCPAVVAEAVAKCIPAVILISGGFREAGDEGRKLEENIRKIIAGTSTRVMGPNCMGVFHRPSGVSTFFLPEERYAVPDNEPNNVSVVSHSGAVAVNLTENLPQVGIRSVVSLGNQIDVDAADVVDFFARDKATEVIALYLEQLGAARRFLEAVRSAGKPVIILKAGKSRAGGRAAMSHTGAMTGRYKVSRAIFRQAGTVEAENLHRFIGLVKTFGFLAGKEVRGNRVAILSNAGGLGVLGADELRRTCLTPAKYGARTVKALRNISGAYLSLNNPTDTGPGVDDRALIKAAGIILADDGVDALAFFPGLGPSNVNAERLISAAVKAAEESDKPIVVYFAYMDSRLPLIRMLEEGRVPYFRTPEDAISALGAFVGYSERLAGTRAK